MDPLIPDRFDEHTVIFLVRSPDAPEMSEEALDALQVEHLTYLRSLKHRGVLIANGPLAEQTDVRMRGMSVYRLPLDEALALARQDPMVLAGRLVIEGARWMTAEGAARFGPEELAGSAQLRHHLGADALESRRVGDAADVEDEVLGAGLGEPAEALDDRIGLLLVEVHARSAPSARSRRRAGRGARNARAGRRAWRATNSGERPKRLQASAYWATSRRVFRSPPPPTRIGIRGRLIDCGELMTWVATQVRAVNSPCVPLPSDHISWANRSVSSSHSNRSFSGGNRKPEALRLEDVPGRTDPEPRPAARQDVEGGRGLDPQAR